VRLVFLLLSSHLGGVGEGGSQDHLLEEEVVVVVKVGEIVPRALRDDRGVNRAQALRRATNPQGPGMAGTMGLGERLLCKWRIGHILLSLSPRSMTLE